MIRLTKSPVVFSEDPHGYTLKGERLSGITSLIGRVLGLGYGDDAAPIVLDFYIPRAGEYGTSVHQAIEVYDKHGIEAPLHPKSERFKEHENDDNWDVSRELRSYIEMTSMFAPLANEYTVSDCARYATNIDNVYLRKKTGGIWLGDTKTTNVETYPGGEDALKEYLSWQLSIEAYLFEGQNPGLKIEGLVCNWLRGDQAEQWDIPRKSDASVAALLSVDWEFDKYTGEFTYFGDDVARLLKHESSLATVDARMLSVPQQTIQAIYQSGKQLSEMEKTYKEMKSRLREVMTENNVKSWDAGCFKATIGKDGLSETFDTAKFKEDHPDLYKEYVKTVERKGGFTIKIRDEDKTTEP